MIADSSLTTQIPDNHGMLQTQLTSEVDKYLQEAAERHERDINYFDRQHVATNTVSQQQKADFVEYESDWKSYLGCMTHAYNCTKQINGNQRNM